MGWGGETRALHCLEKGCLLPATAPDCLSPFPEVRVKKAGESSSWGRPALSGARGEGTSAWLSQQAASLFKTFLALAAFLAILVFVF